MGAIRSRRESAHGIVTAIRCVEEWSVVNRMRVYRGLARGIGAPCPGRYPADRCIPARLQQRNTVFHQHCMLP